MPSVDIHGGAGYWRSLADLAGDPELKAREGHEFPPDVTDGPDPLTRRRFMQLMGASVALAGAAGCSKSGDKILPYSHAVTGQSPGIPRYYATAMELGGVGQRLLVKSFDGRPIKVEGNPGPTAHEVGTSVHALASVLELYDPDRSRHVAQFENGKETTSSWEKFEAAAGPLFKGYHGNGAGLAVLAETTSSPSFLALAALWKQTFPKAAWYEYEPISSDNEREGARLAFGKPYRTLLALDQADVIVCLDADPLGNHPNAVQYTRQFADGRSPDGKAGKMSRLWVVESVHSVTGASADQRLPIKSADVAAFAEALAAAIRHPKDNPTEIPSEPGKKFFIPGGDAAKKILIPGGEAGEKFLLALRQDLLAARKVKVTKEGKVEEKEEKPKVVIVVGPRQLPPVHELVHRLNAELGAVDKTVGYATEPGGDRDTHLAAIKKLSAELDADKVKTLLILGGNPAYNAPADLNFAALLGKAGQTIHLSNYADETSRLCKWHLPRAHYLESWGDVRAYDGTYSVVQPLIAPLFEGRSALEVLALLLGNVAPRSSGSLPGVGPVTVPLPAYGLVRQTFRKLHGDDNFEHRWRKALDDGLVDGTLRVVNPPLKPAKPAKTEPAKTPPPAVGLEVVFVPDTRLYDGRFANLGWLQELPDYLTKLTWDNPALFSPATAAKLKVEHATLVKLHYRGRDLQVAAYVLPGQADDSITIVLGQGRTAAGTVGGSTEAKIDPVGFDTYKLRTTAAPDFDDGLVVVPTGVGYRLATTQDLYTVDPVGIKEREHRLASLVQEKTFEEFKEEKKGHGVHSLPLVELYPQPPEIPSDPSREADHRWAMAIDLTKCTGCNACVVACQSENNVPIVGKDQVLRSRHMHWIRIDRYFRGAPENPEVVHQPVVCMQCENAPCEQVCPVAATMHSAEGLNAMVYNRCIGTRYCSNNCPYKVRRFNFFWNHARLDDPENGVLKLVYNPDVTVRGRGVMEKCTYCVQRIQAVKILAKNKQRAIKDGEIVTACAQACPARAITFGDLKDKDSAVSKQHNGKRAYAMLEELNVIPRTKYLERIRNPHPDLTEAAHEHGHG